jgi:hypothetical protein
MSPPPRTPPPDYHFQRHIPVDETVDLVVAGGGPAGVAAAISAARLGARVVLVEATGCMGGMGTSGLVTAFDPMANGEEMLVGGLMREIVETLYSRGFLAAGIDPNTWRRNFHQWTPFNVEGYKLLLDELAVAAGVELRFFTRVVEADVDAAGRTVNGLILHNIEGFRFVPARTFIDCTGDAVLANMCGAPCREAGRDTPRIMPATLPSLYAGVDWKRLDKKQQHQAYLQALDDGHFTQFDRSFWGMNRISDSTGYLNGGHLFNLNALRGRDLTEGIMLGRRIAHDFLTFYRKYVPGCEAMEHVTTASLIGVRESRRIIGEYELTEQDYFARRQFPDQIGVFNKCIDIHAYDTSDEEWERFNQMFHDTGRLAVGECFGIPYGVLVPRGWRNLWVAGRCVSADVKAHGSIRVQPAASMMGQAAGTAAAQAISRGETAGELDTAALVRTLRQAGAHLPQAELTPHMTRQPAQQ